MPHVASGKPAEQLRMLDQYVGELMKTLVDNEIADNTMVVFTSDNGPASSTISNLVNRKGHLKLSTMRGKKASVYEGSFNLTLFSRQIRFFSKNLTFSKKSIFRKGRFSEKCS